MSAKPRVSREDAVAVCMELGYHTAPKWNRKELGRRLKEIAAEKEDDDEMEVEGELGRVFEAIVASGGDVELHEGDREDPPGPADDDPDEAAGEADDGEPEPEDDQQPPEEEKKPEKKKRGRPKGSKNKAKRDAKPEAEKKLKAKAPWIRSPLKRQPKS